MQKYFYGTTSRIAVSRVISPSSRGVGEGYKAKYNNFKSSRPDAYDLCIKAKAIARSSGAEPALLYALNQLPSPALKSAIPSSSSSGSSKPVLLNTVLTALSREGKSDRFWEVFGAKINGNKTNWSPQLAATLLNQIAKEMEQHLEDATEKNGNDVANANVIDENKINVASVVVVKKKSTPSTEKIDELMKKATSIYIEALETVKVPSHLHLHNAFLKCISRSQNVPFLLWIINKMTPGHFGDINLKVLGVQEFMPVTEDALKLVKFLERPVQLDAQSLTSILATLSRSFDGSITLAETLWSKFLTLKSPPIILDKHCHLALLLVYRNDLSRILRQRKLIRSCSWRERKHTRVLEIIKSAGVDLCKDAKFLSIYYEICLNAKLREKVQAHVQQNPQRIQDKRVFDLIKKSQTIMK